ncbi:unnamed protein product [Clonostachys rosea]|uniref:Amidase domain-containing protein n=1 Tax=Bionectria ochroleuca TaxID=29856 RepID=A0ABY6UDX3_BIOOC|nr:unnamed protein product [Clonostachys rosea]
MFLQTILSSAAIYAGVVAASTVLQLNGSSIYSPDSTETFINTPELHVKSTTPFTYLSFKGPNITLQDFTSEIHRFLSTDDVFNPAFLSTIVVTWPNTTTIRLSPEARTFINNTWASNVVTLPASKCPLLRPGPYFLHPDQSVTKVYRLYADPAMAFVISVTPTVNNSFTPVTGAVQGGINGGVSVAVPSRLYYPLPTAERPLEGKRLAVKDIFDLKGLVTGGGSRSHFALGKVATETAPALQALIDLGAVVVGKSKTTFFALGEYPTADYVDQLAPFNPRGDGYQNPQGSSSGTGAGVASYGWLDFGTGSDTGGSVRLPSKQNGLFGMRITNASLPLDGLIPITPRFDTPGLLTRDASLLQTAYKKWFQSKSYNHYPKRIIMPTEFWPPADNTSMLLYESFVSKMASFLNATVESVNTNASFISYTGASEGIQAYMGKSYSNVTKYDQVRHAVRPFTEAYEAKFGQHPFWNPVPTVEWAYGESVTDEGYNSALSRVLTYGEWFRSQLVPSCEEALVIYPFGPGIVDYRDTYVDPPTTFGGSYAATQQAVYAGVPDYTVPIGSRKYFSRITRRDEELPVTLGIIGAANCEDMLADLVVEMGKSNGVSGFVTKVKTGKTFHTQQEYQSKCTSHTTVLLFADILFSCLRLTLVPLISQLASKLPLYAQAHQGENLCNSADQKRPPNTNPVHHRHRETGPSCSKETPSKIQTGASCGARIRKDVDEPVMKVEMIGTAMWTLSE